MANVCVKLSRDFHISETMNFITNELRKIFRRKWKVKDRKKSLKLEVAKSRNAKHLNENYRQPLYFQIAAML